MSEKATFGLPKNIAAALSYAGVAFTGALFYICEREDKYVRFHALQSIVFFGGMAVLNFVLKFIFGVLRIIPILGALCGFLGGILIYVIGVITFIAWIYLIFNAAVGRKVELPVIGKIVSSQVDR